jgi:hypothetical protein
MSSASKLRAAILKKRAAMSVLHPNVKRRAVGERGQIRIGVAEPEEAKSKPASEQESDEEWEALEDERVDQLCTAGWEANCHDRRMTDASIRERRDIVRRNVRAHIAQSRSIGC